MIIKDTFSYRLSGSISQRNNMVKNVGHKSMKESFFKDQFCICGHLGF